LWPDFDEAALDAAIISYQGRERRFGRTSEQLTAVPPAPTFSSQVVSRGDA
jgi:undecaprenyl diphosphate synthase